MNKYNIDDYLVFIHNRELYTGQVFKMEKSGDSVLYNLKDSYMNNHQIEEKYLFKTKQELLDSL